MNNTAKLNYVVAKPDDRDYIFSLSDVPKLKEKDPATVSYLQLPVNRIENQGNFGSCTSYALTNAFENLVAVKTGDLTYQASPMFNYTQSRILDSVDLNEDPGTTLRSAHGNLRLSGIPRDQTWQYSSDNFTKVPSDVAYEEAFPLSKSITYFEVKRDLPIMKYIIANLRLYVAIGFLVYPSFQSDEVSRTGDIPMPTQQEIANGNIGGHSCDIIGFDDTREVYIILNQYGTSWGKSGLGTLPYSYFEDPNLVSEAKLMLPSDDFVDKYNQYKENFIKTSTITKSSENQNKNWLILLIFIVLTIILSTFLIWKYLRTSSRSRMVV